jgi:SAM-dependent methyltransferase
MIMPAMVAGRDVLDVGAFDVNGTVRPIVEALGPARYMGVDLTSGPGVDEIVDAADLVTRFGRESFDLVITTEMVEHTRDWPAVMKNLKGVLRPGGHLLVTTRSPGFHFHAWPYDFWRYTPDDMRAIFGDLEILTIEGDTDAPGVFVFARRPEAYVPNTPLIPLFSIITGRRQTSVSDFRLAIFRARYRMDLAYGNGRLEQRARRSARRTRSRAVRVVKRVRRLLPLSWRRTIKRAVGRG